MSRPLKILRLITWLPPGGIEKRLCAVLPALRERGFAPEVCCIRERGPLADQLEAAGIPVRVIRFKSRLDPFATNALRRHIAREEFDLVHSHMYRANVAAAMAKRFSRRFPPLVCQIHNINVWQTWRQLAMERRLCGLWDAGVAVSENVRDHVIDKLRIPSKKMHVIYNGVRLDDFKHDARPSRRETFGIEDEDAIVVASLCRLHPQKNPEAIPMLAAELCPRHPRLHFVIAGEGKLGSLMEREIRRLKLQDRVHMLGLREDAPRILAASDVFLLPSFKEGFSNAIVEAMASGLPVVATNVGGNAEAVAGGETGFITKVGDQDELLDRVERLVSDDALRARMASAARERSRLYSLDRMIDATEELYRKLIEKNH